MFRRILLALEGGEAGDVAVSFTVALARHCGAHVDIVHVNETIAGTGGLGTETADQAADLVTAALQEFRAAEVDATGMTYRTSRFDLPAAISDLACECRAEAIVVGSRRRRLHKGGTRESIARRTPLPIITAPSPLKVKRRARGLEAPAERDLPVHS